MKSVHAPVELMLLHPENVDGVIHISRQRQFGIKNLGSSPREAISSEESQNSAEPVVPGPDSNRFASSNLASDHRVRQL